MRTHSIAMLAVIAIAAHAHAQPADPADQPTEPADEDKAQATPGSGWGTYEPSFGKGFNVAKTELGELSLSGYSLFRFIDQLGNDTFVDHLGNVQTVDRRRDLTLHRVLVYLNGWFYDRKFRFNTTVWAILSTQQVNIIGSLTYLFHPAFALTAGVYGLPGTRSLQDIWPYFLGSDRVMADDFFRPGFTSGIWASGEPIKGLKYKAMVGNGLSQVGITAAQLTRRFATSASVAWMPTTDEFGDRGGFGDWERHDRLATRFGVSFTHSRENRQDELATQSPDNNAIRLSDSLNAFATGALAPGVSLQDATYWLIAADAGVKYEGIHVQGEYYYRLLNNLDADGPLPLARIVDQGFYVQASYFAVPRKLCLYGITSVIFGQFDNPWEAGGGANYYPFNTHNFRLNLQADYVHRSAASSLFGYYVGGQTGTTVSAFADLLVLMPTFSLVKGGPFYRLMRRLHLTGRTDTPTGWLLAAVAWVPLAVGELVRATLGMSSDPTMFDISVHTRVLVALPMLLFAESIIDPACRGAITVFYDRKICDSAELDRIVHRAERLRDLWWIELAFVVAALVGGQLVLWHVLGSVGLVHGGQPAGAWSFPRLWYATIALPLVHFVMFRSTWHYLIWGYVLARLARQPLAALATNPDRAAGLAPLAWPTTGFSGFALAMSAILSGAWGTQVLAHRTTFQALYPGMVVFMLAVFVLAFGPLLMFSGHLFRARRLTLFQYGELTDDYVRRFHAKWIESKADDSLLGSPDIQSLADIGHAFHAIASASGP